VQKEKEVLDAAHANPSSSTGRVAYETSLSQSEVWRTLNLEKLYPYRAQLAQVLQAGDSHHRLQFCRWFLHKTVDEPGFLCHVL
jgi:hypothetical protein